MAKYNVLVTARSFGTVDDLAVNLLQKHDCEIKKLEEKDGPIPEQLKKSCPPQTPSSPAWRIMAAS